MTIRATQLSCALVYACVRSALVKEKTLQAIASNLLIKIASTDDVYKLHTLTYIFSPVRLLRACNEMRFAFHKMVI